MWSALKERPGYENENWLIIVTSNYGGDVQMVEGKEFADHYADVSRNTFTLMYNERLVSQIQAAPGIRPFLILFLHLLGPMIIEIRIPIVMRNRHG